MKQADIFLESEGNNWLERNRTKLGERDPVSELIEQAGIKPTSVLEIGCANGWRLAIPAQEICCGSTELSRACRPASRQRPRCGLGCTAKAFQRVTRPMIFVIYGFCLYVADPPTVQNCRRGRRVLRPDGHIIVHDFSIRPDDEAHVRLYSTTMVLSLFMSISLISGLLTRFTTTLVEQRRRWELVEIIHKGHTLRCAHEDRHCRSRLDRQAACDQRDEARP